MKKRKITKYVVAGLATTLASEASAAYAQTTQEPSTSEQDDSRKLDVIVVTSQKREERLQDVPLSVSAFSENDIEDQGITSIDDYAVRSPGVRLARESSQATITIRGIGTSTFAGTTSPTAGIYIDDYPVYDTWYRFTSPDLRIFDVERIEVLRGPQGTLYGATSLAGSVRIITNKPELDIYNAKFEGTLSSVEDGGSSYALNGMVNIPVVEDKLAVRAVAYTREDGGYVDNIRRNEENVNETGAYGGRFLIRALPTESLSILANLTYQHDRQDDHAATFYFPPQGADTYDYDSFSPVQSESEFFFANLIAEQELFGGTLAFSGLYAENSSRNRFDESQLALLLGVPPEDAVTPMVQPSDSDSSIFELRYNSDGSKPFRYVLGAYYNSRFRSLEQDIINAALVPNSGIIYDVDASQRATEQAVFGEGTWDFAEKWEATVGLRVFKNDYEFNSDVAGLLNDLNNPTLSYITDTSNSQTDYTPRFSLSYQPTDDINIYGTISKGYRFGLTNYNSGATEGTPLTYKSDTLWNYEVGAKATILDGAGTINTALYYIDWKDIQMSFRNANGQIYITNVGDARSYGLETEVTLRPMRGLDLNGALSLGRAEVTEDNAGIIRQNPSSISPGVIGIKAGDPLPGSQEISASAGVQYTFFDVGSGDVYVRLDDIYVGESYPDFQHENSLKTGDYNLLNLRLGYRTEGFELVGFINNVANSDGVVNALPNANFVFQTDAAFRVAPRTVGVTLRKEF